MKQYLTEFFTPIAGEPISHKKMRTAGIIRMSAVSPTIYLLTLISLIMFKKNSYDHQASNSILLIWISLFIAYIIINIFIISEKRRNIIHVLSLVCIVIESATNQLILYATGSLTSHATIFIAILVCIYRVFFDYRISLFAVAASSILYAMTAFLEVQRIIPLAPYLPAPLEHIAYNDPLMAFSCTMAVILGVLIIFFITNFSMNQIAKLNRYILDSWKDDLKTLQSFSQNVTDALSLNAILQQTFKVIAKIKLFDMALFMMLDEKDNLIIESSFGWQEDWIKKYMSNTINKLNSTFSPLFNLKKPVTISNIKASPDLSKVFYGIPMEFAFCLPLLVFDKIYGILLLSSPSPVIISDHQMHMLSGIVNQTEIAIQNHINLKEEKIKATTDALTGLNNRRFFDEQLKSTVREALIHSYQVSLIMIDIDDFKKYNDIFGHQAGDEILATVSNVISNCIRSKDFAARFGGEEFVVILEQTNKQDAVQIAERIRSSIEKLPIDCVKSKVTVSIGISTLPERGKDMESLIKDADESLYYSKRNGKNRIYYA
jgi:diguanylate cyclase (GGDEF)-like protein